MVSRAALRSGSSFGDRKEMFSIRNQKNERKKMKLDLISETKRVDSISNQKDRNKGFRFDSNRKNKSITLTLGDKGAALEAGQRRCLVGAPIPLGGKEVRAPLGLSGALPRRGGAHWAPLLDRSTAARPPLGERAHRRGVRRVAPLKASRPLIRVLVINDNGLWINKFI